MYQFQYQVGLIVKFLIKDLLLLSYFCCLEDKLMFSIIYSQLSLQLQQFRYLFINLEHTKR